MAKKSMAERSLERMIEQLELRGLSQGTQVMYSRIVRRFMKLVKDTPRAVRRQDVEKYLLDLARAGRSPETRNLYLAAIRYWLRSNVSRDVTEKIRMAKEPRTMKRVLSGTEIDQLLSSTQSLKYRAVFTVAYGAGLRIGEVCALHIDDIDSKRMLIRVRGGK